MAYESGFCDDIATEMKPPVAKAASGLKTRCAYHFHLYFTGLLALTLLMLPVPALARDAGGNGAYKDLLQLFENWREFEHPPLLDGALVHRTEYK